MIKRIVVEVSDEFHQKLKQKAVNERTSIRAIVTKILEEKINGSKIRNRN